MTRELVIRLRDIEKSYGTGNAKTAVLRGVSLDIAKGEVVALVGQSGSGKSTLLNIIGGLDTADGGTVEVLGRRFSETNEKIQASMRNQDLGFVFQAFNLLDHLSCLGNVTMPQVFAPGGKDADKRGLVALDRVGLADFAHRRPSELSGGQKQRVAIARALFNQPKVLLCDEPTGNLDSETGRQVIEFFTELNERDGVTLLIVTHEERVSRAASRVIKIEDGVIIEGQAVYDDDGSVSSGREEPAAAAETSDGSDGEPEASDGKSDETAADKATDAKDAKDTKDGKAAKDAKRTKTKGVKAAAGSAE